MTGTRSHKRHNHIYIVHNTKAEYNQKSYEVLVTLNQDNALHSAITHDWGEPFDSNKRILYDTLEITDAGMANEQRSSEPILVCYKNDDIEETYRQILDTIDRIQYISPNKKKSKPQEQLEDQISFEELNL